MDVTEIGCVAGSWFQVARHRVQWRAGFSVRSVTSGGSATTVLAFDYVDGVRLYL
jgi:hypothetical protein